MFKQVFLYDGTPYLAFLNSEGEYDYPEESWTEIAPPEGIYSPFYFNGNEWVGANKEEYEATLPKKEPYVPSNGQKQLAQTQMQLAKTAVQIQKTQNQLADAMLEIAKLKGEN
ncbi:hypothetical protein BUZ11_04170 [Staphylococcus gallinarum]|uniref:hypothetical protein n=1 Tax=Staphylococcus gallinarum TaxID=1293 RepID=UPI000D1E03AA|nr:hypothetical protein [Staphylococcus gallinarum]PTL09952.1 hypothetical protein BUZ09_04730 [Staphylococcus gallinarum]RIL23792.1 hypothetical protein BUY99_04325 [Staphylococcus gallinarum]RIL29923.1 hypothetical protein BUY98_12775 [Staphylococcus gallinarum]RIO77367.1 hypothetical protein BUZ12_04540 [Staphylococcus gallinarum]RIO83619.1 hypothetical protein BUZ11_04170 [Staphylococcus gallinarum]